MIRVSVRTTTTADIDKNVETTTTPQQLLDSLGINPGINQVYLDGVLVHDGRDNRQLSKTFEELDVADGGKCVLNVTVKSSCG